MSIVQMVLLALACAFCRMEGGWFGECKLRQPIVTSFFVGLILIRNFAPKCQKDTEGKRIHPHL